MRTGPIEIHAVLFENYGKPVTLCDRAPWELMWGQVWVDADKNSLDVAKKTNPEVPACAICEDRIKSGWHHLRQLGKINL